MPRRRMIVEGSDFEEDDLHATPLDKDTLRVFKPKKKKRNHLLMMPDDEFVPMMEQRRRAGQEDA